jgi:ubiquitin C-terminal hydrolase
MKILGSGMNSNTLNSCWFYTMIQFILNCKRLINRLRALPILKEEVLEINNNIIFYNTIVDELLNLSFEYEIPDGKILDVSKLRKLFGKRFPEFKHATQEDVGEAIDRLFETLDNIRTDSLRPTGCLEFNINKTLRACHECNHVMDDIILKDFVLRLQMPDQELKEKQTKTGFMPENKCKKCRSYEYCIPYEDENENDHKFFCAKCEKVIARVTVSSQTEKKQIEWSNTMPNPYTLNSLITNWQANNSISDFKCTSCSKVVEMSEFWKIQCPPETLLIQLGRFEETEVKGGVVEYHKKKDLVRIPECLDLRGFELFMEPNEILEIQENLITSKRQFVNTKINAKQGIHAAFAFGSDTDPNSSESDDDCFGCYSLVGAMSHFGGSKYGHYTYDHKITHKKWVRHDDDSLYQIPPPYNYEGSLNTYILVYHLINTPEIENIKSHAGTN